MLKRKEILAELKKMGFDRAVELKTGCRDYEKYFQCNELKQRLENPKQGARS